MTQLMDTSDYSTILYERIGAVARILHNRPQVRNAENSVLLDELDDAVERATADPAVKVIVIGGTGDHFSAGHDIKEGMAERKESSVEQRWEYETRRYFGYAMKIWDCPKPTIAQVQGACIAGGFMVANMCDLIVASDDAFFADPVCRSLAAASVEVLVHPWVMGLRAAKEFLFTGERMPAEEAKRIGMVNRVVERMHLETATMALAEKIAEGPAFALALTKRSLNRTADMQGFRSALSAHFDTHQLSHATQEAAEVRERGSAAAISSGRSAAH
jgi:enoyl-CoA hydratase